MDQMDGELDSSSEAGSECQKVKLKILFKMYLTQLLAKKRAKFLYRISHYTERSDFFIIQRYFEKIYALHYTARGWRDRTLWYLYRALYGLIYLSYIYKTYWVVHHSQDSFSSANIFGVMWFFSAVILRVVILEWHYPLMERLQHFLNDHSYQRRNPWTMAKRAEFYRRTNRVILAVMAINFVEIVCFTATNVMKLEDFMLRWRGEIVSSRLVQIVYGVLTMGWGGMYCMGFMVCYLLMCIFNVEVDILLHSLEDIGRGVRSEKRLGFEDGEDIFWNNIVHQLRPHMERLEELFVHLQQLKTVIGPIAFVQYYSTYLVIADCCFILASHGLSSFSIVYLISMVVFLTEFFFLCHSVESLRDLKPRVSSALYDFDWMLRMRCSNERQMPQYRHVRRTFLLITAHSDQAIRFSFAGIGEISMNSFAQLLERSYSMLTFLLQFAK
uniref:Odorant receptor n=1 Tax=Anopheles christyi TaxID=43041 RepID=A0A182K500_9DIPT